MRYLKGCTMFAALVAVVFAASSCKTLFPERLDATVTVNRDGSYKIAASGMFVEYFARTAITGDGRLSEDERRDLAEIGRALKDDPAFKKAELVGDDSFSIVYEDEGVLRSEAALIDSEYFADLMTITPLEGGRVELTGIEMPETGEDIAEVREDLEKMRVDIDWRIRVKTNARVISHNAGKTPWLFGLLGAYEWRIKSLDGPTPHMLIQLEQPAADPSR